MRGLSIGLVAACQLLPLTSFQAHALTRAQVLSNVYPLMQVQYTITSANVYPNAQGGCYTGSTAPNGSHLPVGTWTGVVYGYGLMRNDTQVVADLAAGKGAGDWKALYDQSSVKADCIRAHCTGIDCSGLASQGWGLPKYGTCSFTGDVAGGPILASGIARSAMDIGDIVAKCGDHVMVAGGKIDANGDFLSYEATGNESYNRCVAIFPRDFDELESRGFHPYVSAKLKDRPDALVVRCDAETGNGGASIVTWETLLEDKTGTFAVCRSASPSGPFSAISIEMPAQGSATTGASYSFTDPTPQGQVYYRVRETEIGGLVIWHRIVSSAEGALLSGGRK